MTFLTSWRGLKEEGNTQGGAKGTHVFEMGGSQESFFLWG